MHAGLAAERVDAQPRVVGERRQAARRGSHGAPWRARSRRRCRAARRPRRCRARPAARPRSRAARAARAISRILPGLFDASTSFTAARTRQASSTRAPGTLTRTTGRCDAQLGFGGEILQHAVLAAVGEAPQLVGVALGVDLRDRRARALDVAVVHEHHARARLEAGVQRGEEFADALPRDVRPPEHGERRHRSGRGNPEARRRRQAKMRRGRS